MKGSKLFATKLPNIPPFTTDCQVHLYSASGSGVVDVYHDDGTAGTAATLYAPWKDDSGNQVSYDLSYSTQGSPLRSISVTSGTTVYVMVVYSVATGFTVQYQTSGPFSYADARNDAYGDLGVFAIVASVTTDVSITAGSGGTGTFAGNGGANAKVRVA